MVVTVPSSAEDALSLCLFELGSCGFETREEGEMSRLTAYFGEEADAPALCRAVEDHLQAAGLAGSFFMEIGREVECDWEREWRRFYRPEWVTDRLVVHPSWIPVEVSGDQIAIAIDPEMAFGTGGHETTQLCLQALEEWLIPGSGCLDLGTGSGVLAIAAVGLGAASVTALDTDPRALANARRNITANLSGTNREGVIALCQGSVTVVAGQLFDCIVANLDGSTIASLLPGIAALLAPGGVLVLSGLLVREEERFGPLLANAGLEVRRVRRKNEWLCLMAAATGRRPVEDI